MNWIRENIEKSPSFAPFAGHMDAIDHCLYSNPGLCVETCKALIEGICKTILINKNIEFPDDIPFQGLVRNTISNILNTDEAFNNDLVELGRRIASVAQKIAEIRNNGAGFAAHGMDVLNPRLTETISILIYKITDTIGGFILTCYINNRILNPDQRIHYADCAPFNEYYDGLYPI